MQQQTNFSDLLKMASSNNRLGVLLGHVNSSKSTFNGVGNFLVTNDVAGAALNFNPGGIDGQFSFTLDNPRLSPKQRNFYEENGYVVIPKLVKEDALDSYRERFLEYCERKVHFPGVTVMKDVTVAKSNASLPPEFMINKIQDFICDDILRGYCTTPELLDYVECFTGPDIMGMHTMLINKPPDAGTMSSRHPLHQDLYYFPFGPANQIVCAWTAIDKVTRDNGCLVVIPGTHKGELLRHGYPEWEGGVNRFYHGIMDLNESEANARVHLEMGKGDTVFFHPLIIHGSGTNRTKGCRKAISCHYASSNCHYMATLGTQQKAIMQEIGDFLKEKRGLVLDDLADIWRPRSILVRGERINL